jgi:transposase
MDMDIVVEKGCGLDVHKKTIAACVMGEGIKKEIRTYDTMTKDLLQLKQWLKENGITHVAMESTGVYWKPVFNILEDSFEVILVNARHIKHVPGRKTDVKDSEWLCKLLRAGLLSASLIPPKDIRELRDLTRYQRKLVQTISAEKNRIQRVLEDANIKLSSVLSDSFGVSGQEMISELMKGELTIEQMAKLAKGRLNKKKKEIEDALVGRIEEHHKFMIKASLRHIELTQKIIADIDSEIDKKMEKHREKYELLQTMPGVKERAAASIIAETGADMDRFPTEGHLSSWAGMSPGNNESAGKKKSGKTTHGNKCLKTTLTESAWAALRTKSTYFNAKYHSLVGRRGKKRALVAVGHKMLIASYYIMRDNVPYQELGTDYLDSRKKDKIVFSYIRRLKTLGYSVILNGLPDQGVGKLQAQHA